LLWRAICRGPVDNIQTRYDILWRPWTSPQKSSSIRPKRSALTGHGRYKSRPTAFPSQKEGRSSLQLTKWDDEDWQSYFSDLLNVVTTQLVHPLHPEVKTDLEINVWSYFLTNFYSESIFRIYEEFATMQKRVFLIIYLL